MRFFGLFILIVVALLAVDGVLSLAAALDRWVGTVNFPEGFLAFVVLVDPGKGASFEWRGRNNILVASGSLIGAVSGSRVDGTLFTTGGVIFRPGVCCRPCNFIGTITGNTVNGALDADSCSDRGVAAPFSLVKQGTP
jgi:hypothetical protein